jgi:microcystin-dependent protein
MSDLYPVGTVLPFAEDLTQAIESQLVSQGYIPCDGRALAKSDTEYQALYQVIGGSYGEDDTSFFVPDYRGRFLRGTDLGAGRDPDAATRTSPNPGATKPGNEGDAVGSVQPAALAGHTHGYTGHHNDHKIDYGGAETPGVFDTNATSGASSSVGGNETRPKNTSVNLLIAYM